jgi:GNAT superfamily N-acetyltransferase
VIAAMPVEIWDARRFTPAQARAIGELINQVWPKPNLTADDRAAQQLAIGRDYSGPARQAPTAMVVVEDDRVVAHAAMLPRQVGTTAGDLWIGGLARVCTEAAYRGRGLGEHVVRAAFGLVDAGDFAFTLFQTSRRVQPFYNKLGAVPVENRIVNSLADDPTANAFWDEVVMRYPAGGEWPHGKIDLRGPGW